MTTMTLTDVAIMALTRNNYMHASQPRRARIATRFKLVYAQDMCAWVKRDQARLYADNNVWVTRGHPMILCECGQECPNMYASEMIRGSEWRSAFRQQVCVACITCNTWTCDNCGVYIDDDLSRNSIEESDFCRTCYTRHMDSIRVSVPAYHGAKRWEYDVYSPSYSMEWEVVAGNRERLVEVLNQSGIPKLSWESDGSLPSGRGLEMLLQHRASLDELAEDAIKLSQAVYRKNCEISAWGWKDGDGNPSAGIHINSNRDKRFVSRTSVARVLIQVSVNRDLICKIAGRRSDRWATFPNKSDRFMLKAWANGSFGKYLAVRVGGDRMEWRCFRSTMSRSRLKLYCDTVRIIEDLAMSKLTGIHLLKESRNQLQSLISSFNQ